MPPKPNPVPVHPGSGLNLAFIQLTQRLGVCRYSAVLVYLATDIGLVIDGALLELVLEFLPAVLRLKYKRECVRIES